MEPIRARMAVAMTILTAALAAAPQGALATDAPAARPKLVIAEPTKDFGNLVTGAQLEHSFVLRNEGNAPLTIRELRPGMAPSRITHFDAVIPPGATGRVDVWIDGLKVAGAGATKIEVLTDDPDRASAVLELKWNVEAVVVAKPDRARWLYVQDEPTGTIEHRVWAKDGQPFAVLGVDAPAPYIRVTFREADEGARDPKIAGSQWLVDLTVDSKAPPGAVEGLVVVRTSHPRQARMPIPISGFVRPRYILEPEWGKSTNLGSLQLSAPTAFTFKLRNFATDPVEVAKAETTIPGITATAAPAQVDATRHPVTAGGHFFDITVRLDPAAMAPGPFNGKVVVRLSDPHQPTVEMPLSGELVKAAPAAG